MPGRVSKYGISLKKKQRRRLRRIVRRRRPSHWLVHRAQIILQSDHRRRITEVCAGLSCDRQVVRRWRKRFLDGGVDALKDCPRRGRPRSIQPRVWQKITTLVVQPPTKFGVEQARWSIRTLVWFIKRRYGWKVSRSSVSRFLRSMAIKPHRVKYWLNPKDPDFDQKAEKICQLYLNPPKGITVLSIDEKPGLQALSAKYPDLPMRPGNVRRVEFEYRRNGTRNIFAAFNIRTGKVLVQVTKDRKVPRLVAFLDLIFSAGGPLRGSFRWALSGRDSSTRRSATPAPRSE